MQARTTTSYWLVAKAHILTGFLAITNTIAPQLFMAPHLCVVWLATAHTRRTVTYQVQTLTPGVKIDSVNIPWDANASNNRDSKTVTVFPTCQAPFGFNSTLSPLSRPNCTAGYTFNSAKTNWTIMCTDTMSCTDVFRANCCVS